MQQSIEQLKRQLETAATNKLQILVSRADLKAALAEIDALKARLAEAEKTIEKLRHSGFYEIAQKELAAHLAAEARADTAEEKIIKLEGQIDDAVAQIVKLSAAEARADGAEKRNI